MRGGKRPGAGRKLGFAAKNAEEARKYFSERVAAEIVPLCDTLINRAKKGDMRAIKELFDRAWGRTPQALQIEDNTGKLPVPIMVRFMDMASKEGLETYKFSDEEREVLEKRLIPKQS